MTSSRNAFANAKNVPLYELIGSPAWKASDTISDVEIQTELSRINKILNENNIAVDTICKVDDREL